ncbi:hypothetical protein SAMN05443633_109158 [Chryseobacterium arachidis]|uniref:DUF3887 domain-containing protein n=2 Tax=Chryseobacterium arachidis TaxID=1416778 RepID=A0A1M5GJV6_9FLAO|nr:hypothetical protein SAMN05443633_109158 [Chryseobacterium arachidis]
MKKLLLISCISLSVFGFGQKKYTKIDDSKINQARLEVGKSFIDEYIKKCRNKDYSEFKGFLIDKRIEAELYKKLPKTCEENGKMELLDFNSAYEYDNLKYDDPVDVYIYDFKLENLPELKYASVWVYEDKNVIGSIYFSKDKPIYKKKRKK